MRDSAFDLRGHVALVTGGGQGLGRAMALALAEFGAKVIVTARTESTLSRVADEICAAGGKATYIAADVRDFSAIASITSHAKSAFGDIDILLNNVGVYSEAPIDQLSEEEWLRSIETNVTSAMRLTRALTPAMRRRRWGRIINVSSILGLASRPMCNVYSATKSALIGLTKASAFDLGPYGITVNCLAPGAFNTVSPDTPLNERQKVNFERSTALGRWGKPAELAGPVLLLASDAGSYITGTVLTVDGGATARILY